MGNTGCPHVTSAVALPTQAVEQFLRAVPSMRTTGRVVNSGHSRRCTHMHESDRGRAASARLLHSRAPHERFDA